MTSSFNVRHSASCQVTYQYVVVFVGVEVLRIPKKKRRTKLTKFLARLRSLLNTRVLERKWSGKTEDGRGEGERGKGGGAGGREQTKKKIRKVSLHTNLVAYSVRA